MISFAYYGIATPFFRAPSVNRVCQEKGISVENYLITQLKTISAKRKLNFEIVHQYVHTYIVVRKSGGTLEEKTF